MDRSPLMNQAPAPAPAAAARPMIEIHGLCYARDGRAILDDVDIIVPRGEVVVVMGPSGVGKTTLLKLILGQLKPDRGEILVDGQAVTRMDRSELFRARRNIGVLFQSGALLTDLTVYDNVALPIREHTRLPPVIVDLLVKLKLQAVGLRGAAHLMPVQLSGGMARRVALARAVALDPDLVLYDEPFAGLDPIALGAIQRLVHDLGDALGLTSLIVTHKVDMLDRLADRAFIIANAKVVGAGTPQEIRDHDSELVRQFLSGAPDGPVPFHVHATPLEEAMRLKQEPER